MDATSIIIALVSAIAGFGGSFLSRNTKKEENDINANDFTFKSLQSENKRLYEQVNNLLKDKEMLVQQIDILQVAFAAELEQLQQEVKGYKQKGEDLQKQVEELSEKLVN